MNNGHHADETALYELIAKVGSAKEAEELFADLCTMNEIAGMAQRLAAAKLLIEGKTYEQVIAETDISSATLSRVSKCVKYGDGYRRFLTEEGKTE